MGRTIHFSNYKTVYPCGTPRAASNVEKNYLHTHRGITCPDCLKWLKAKKESEIGEIERSLEISRDRSSQTNLSDSHPNSGIV